MSGIRIVHFSTYVTAKPDVTTFVLAQYGLKASVLKVGLEHVTNDQMVADTIQSRQ